MSQSSVFRGTARKVFCDNDETKFMYHNTDVVRVSKDGKVTLNSGGYRTATTKLAINQVSNQYGYGFNVYQANGQWYVRFMNGSVHDYFDGFQFTVSEAHAKVSTGKPLPGTQDWDLDALHQVSYRL